MKTSWCGTRALAAAACLLWACGGVDANSGVSITPSHATAAPNGQQSFAASVASVTWSIKEGASGGSISSTGLYTAPATPGTFTVVATEPSSGLSGQASVTVSAAAPAGPVISSFSASPGTLPTGGGKATLSWSVTGATSLSIDNGVGTVSGTSVSVSVTTSTVFTLTATNASGSTTASASVYVASGTGTNPPGGARYAAMVAPVDGETFTGPTTDLRFVGIGFDNGSGDFRNASQVQFLVDGNAVLTVPGASSEYWVFKGFATGLSLSPGDHVVVTRATYPSAPTTVDSPPIVITVQAAPTYAKTINMTGDLTPAQLAAQAGGSLVGSASAPVRVNGNGYRIYDPGSSTAVNWQYVDFYNLGSTSDFSANGVDVTTTGNVTIQNCRFDYSNPVRLSIGGSASATVRSNLFRSNMRQPLGQLPGPTSSYPVLTFTGGSSAAKTFAGNNVGAGWVEFDSASNWTVGGDTDADSNVLIGPRVGIALNGSSGMTIRRNYTDHIYYGGWSQGGNYELSGSAATVEHNVIVGSSWPVRLFSGESGEVRYNLVVCNFENCESWVWVNPNSYIHHNVFMGGAFGVRGGIYNTWSYTGIRILNNTFDELGHGGDAVLSEGAETVDSNAFLNTTGSGVNLVNGTLTAGNNSFWNSSTPYYSDSRSTGTDKTSNPLFTNPATHMFEWDERAIWQRTSAPRTVLSQYRARYTPAAGSPLIDAGSTSTFGAGNDIGAVGAGTSNAADQFGK
jgi:hypothetical protein